MSATKQIHKVTNVDRDAKTGTCAVCGPVKVRLHPNRAECMTVRQRNRHGNTPEKRLKYLERSALRGKLNRAKVEALVRASRSDNNFDFNFTADDYTKLLTACGNTCPLCTRPFKRRPSIDHDHNTGAVRGLICSSCNTGLGFFKDDSAALRRAADYLDTHNTL